MDHSITMNEFDIIGDDIMFNGVKAATFVKSLTSTEQTDMTRCLEDYDELWRLYEDAISTIDDLHAQIRELKDDA